MDAIGQGLAALQVVEVAPSSTAFHLAAVSAENKLNEEPAPALARATGSGWVVTGWYFLEGERLRISANIFDAGANRILWAVEPANGTKEKPSQAVDFVRQRVVDYAAARYLIPGRDLMIFESVPPAYEAQKECLAGVQLYGTVLAAARVHYQKALEIDPNYAFWQHPRVRQKPGLARVSGNLIIPAGAKSGQFLVRTPIRKNAQIPRISGGMSEVLMLLAIAFIGNRGLLRRDAWTNPSRPRTEDSCE